VRSINWLRRSMSHGTPVEDRFRLPDLPESPLQRKLRERRERMEALMAGPPPAAEALRKAMAWQQEIETGTINRAGIARRERVTRARVTQIMSLLDLPEGERERLMGAHGPDGLTSIRAALRSVNARRACE